MSDVKTNVSKQYKTLETLQIQYVSPADVKPNSYNPNRQSDRDFELLLKSMKEDGFTQPVIVQKSTGEIVDGEHRWRASQALGMEKIPVVYVEMTDEQRQKFEDKYKSNDTYTGELNWQSILSKGHSVALTSQAGFSPAIHNLAFGNKPCCDECAEVKPPCSRCKDKTTPCGCD